MSSGWRRSTCPTLSLKRSHQHFASQKTKLWCHKCRTRDHCTADWPMKAKREAASDETAEEKPAESALSVTIPESLCFYFDSGASDHIYRSKAMDINLSVVCRRSCSQLPFKGIGEEKVTLKNVLYVPSNHYNLIFVSRAATSGAKFLIEENNVFLFPAVSTNQI